MILYCKKCGKEINSKTNKVFCSRECRKSSLKNCLVCGKEFEPNPTKRFFCSKQCRGKTMLGENNTAKNPDVRKKISESLKGREFSEEHRRKNSEAHKGKKLSKEHREAISRSQIGCHRLSDEEKEKRRQYMLSDRNPSKRPEIREKLRIARSLQVISPESYRKAAEARRGQKRSSETRLKQSLAQRGEKGSNWQGGLTELSFLIRSSSYYIQWRTIILKRNNFKCVWCREDNRSLLEVDHIKPFSLIIRQNKIKTTEEAFDCFELWDIDNGRTLCQDCHKLTDTYAGKIFPILKHFGVADSLSSYLT